MNIYYNYHKNKYPKLEKQDIIKLIFQSSLGPSHFVSNKDKVKDYLNKELLEEKNNEENLYEYISTNYVRMNIFPYKHYFKETDTLIDMFIESANKANYNKDILKENLLNYLTLDDLKNYDYQAVSHSKTYKDNYKPHYRLINSRFIDLNMKYIQLDNFLNKQKDKSIIAIEGRCGSGKSTLSELFKDKYTIIHLDDFFISIKEKSKINIQKYGNINYKLVYENLSIIRNALNQNIAKVTIKAFSCEKQEYYEKEINLKNKIILEGTYSSSLYFNEFIDKITFLLVSKETQTERIQKRELSNKFFSEWIPLEESYFKENDIISNCDLII